MGLIIIHAGMSKAGSSSVQRWLGEHAALLRERGAHPVRVVQRTPASSIEVVPSRGDTSQSFPVLNLRRPRPPDVRIKTLEQILEQIDACANRLGAIVLSNEDYASLFWEGIREFRVELNALADAHTVRVAYYVRPQDTWLEAAWRQWGFRHLQGPSGWLRRQKRKLRYWETLRTVREEAPRVSFEVRPARRDLLEGGDVVTDFAKCFLGLQDTVSIGTDDVESNRGFPLEFAILLRGAPPGVFWSSLHDNATLKRLKRIVFDWPVPESTLVAESRAVLQQYCYHTFEPGNLELVKELDWGTQHFVQPIPGEPDQDPAACVELLDRAWRPKASDAERQMLFCVLQQLLSDSVDRGA
ncbi:MAG: hypothetical protein ACRDWD_02540 [Acidimicrobiia bacterium]